MRWWMGRDCAPVNSARLGRADANSRCRQGSPDAGTGMHMNVAEEMKVTKSSTTKTNTYTTSDAPVHFPNVVNPFHHARIRTHQHASPMLVSRLAVRPLGRPYPRKTFWLLPASILHSDLHIAHMVRVRTYVCVVGGQLCMRACDCVRAGVRKVHVIEAGETLKMLRFQ